MIFLRRVIAKVNYHQTNIGSRVKLKYFRKAYSTDNANVPPPGHLRQQMLEQYNKAKQACKALSIPVKANPCAIFANNQLELDDIEFFGFDYDYTLAVYTKDLHYLIYDLARQELINKHKYPEDIKYLEYDPDFSIRGLHFDVRQGLLLKIDAFHKIQLNSVYRGLECLSAEQVIKLYNGSHVPLRYMSDFHGRGDTMLQLVDWFTPPLMSLLANVVQYFIDHNIEYDPSYVYHDINTSVVDVHTKGSMKNMIVADPAKYIHSNDKLHSFFSYLRSHGKKVFLVTNSDFPFVDNGMTYLLGEDWRTHFDLIVAKARKPKFFDEVKQRPFRHYNVTTGQQGWDRVTALKSGEVYVEGNIMDFNRLTGWYGGKVLYFGDHVYSDLADPAVRFGWRTAMVIPELEREIQVQSQPEYQDNMRWTIVLQKLIELNQTSLDREVTEVTEMWRQELHTLKNNSKEFFNSHFGSCFHSFTNATYFSRRLSRYSDLYTANCCNLNSYSLNHVFYPQRLVLSHELPLHMPWFLYDVLSCITSDQQQPAPAAGQPTQPSRLIDKLFADVSRQTNGTN